MVKNYTTDNLLNHVLFLTHSVDRSRTDQLITKQISLSASPIIKHVIHTHNIYKVTFNYDIYP